jgi:hypothetical protein
MAGIEEEHLSRTGIHSECVPIESYSSHMKVTKSSIPGERKRKATTPSIFTIEESEPPRKKKSSSSDCDILGEAQIMMNEVYRLAENNDMEEASRKIEVVLSKLKDFKGEDQNIIRFNVEVLEAKGQILMDLGEYFKAIQTCELAIALDGDCIPAMMTLGRVRSPKPEQEHMIIHTHIVFSNS